MRLPIDLKVRRMLRRAVKNNFQFFLALVFLHSGMAFASPEVVFKANRPPKKIFESKEDVSGEEKKEGAEEKRGGFAYDPTGKTDPFKSFIAIQEELEEKKKSKPKTYLETLDLSQLELIAVVMGPEGNWAMVRDSKGLGHVIRKGTAIGTNGGVVEKITAKEVIIREEYRDFRGTSKYRNVAKELPSQMELGSGG